MSTLFVWRRLIASATGPSSPTTRHVLLTLSLHMDDNGGSCFPSTRTLAEETGLSERSVISHLAIATEKGWLNREVHGLSGQGWKRNGYQAEAPQKALKEIHRLNHEGTEIASPPCQKGTEPLSKGTEPDNIKALKEVQYSSSSSNKKRKIFMSDSDEFRLSHLLFSLIRENNPKSKEPNLQTWAAHIDLAIRRDGRTPDELERVIRWCQADSFWCGNILSTDKLRKQFDRLWVQMSKRPNRMGPANDPDAALRRCL